MCTLPPSSDHRSQVPRSLAFLSVFLSPVYHHPNLIASRKEEGVKQECTSVRIVPPLALKSNATERGSRSRKKK